MRLADAIKLAGSRVTLVLARGRIISGWSVERAVETSNLFFRDRETGKVIREEMSA
jgi:hypothetical protein